jgi:hypothetical protein
MIVCRFSPRIIIALENEVILLKNKDNFPVDSKYNLQYPTSIL